MFPEILYEDNHLLAVNKPVGLLTQGDISGDPSLLDELKLYIKRRDSKPGNVFLGMVQRLDRPVSGVIVFAKTSKAASRVSEQIRDHRVEKIYVAVTGSPGQSGRHFDDWQEIRHQLVRVKDKTVADPFPEKKSQLGILKIKTLFTNTSCSFHLIRLITGRKHQIRAQLSVLGYPILGDRKYGSKTDFPMKTGIGLHAHYCSLKHPVKSEKIEILTKIPAALLQNFSSLERVALLRELDKEIINFEA